MKVEREIEGIAFPFAAGVAVAVIPGVPPCSISPAHHILTCGAVMIFTALIMYSHLKNWQNSTQWALVLCCTLAAGISTGLSGMESELSKTASEVAPIAREAGKELENLIDSIPFKGDDARCIIKALLTGNKEGIPDDIEQSFRDSGASHILALSGLHLGIIYAVVVNALSMAGNTTAMRRTKSVLTILICGFYTLATGAGASITRAFIFIALNETARMTGRHANLKSILAVSLLIHLTIDPMAVSEIGFQLSYAAIFGIAFIFPWLKKMWCNDWPGLKWIWQSTALSISCQLTTGPIAYYYFGTFPQYFMLTNLIAVPLAGIIIPTALVTIVLNMAGCCPEFFINVTEWLVKAMTYSLNVIASL